MHARFDLHRNVGEPLHDLGASRRAALIDDLQILGATERLTEHFTTVDEDQQDVASLHGEVVEVDAQIGNREPIVAVGREVVAECHAATRAERKPVDVADLIERVRRGLRVMRAGELRHRLAHGHACGDARRRDVLIEEGGRDAEGRRDVVEPLDLDLGREQRLRIELDAEQLVHRRPELGAREPLDGHMSRHGT